MAGGTTLGGGGSGGRDAGTRMLLALVIGLGVLILAGFVVVVMTLAHRVFGSGSRAAALQAGAPVSTVSLGEPPGTRILSSVALGDRLALILGGGGNEDRVVLLDSESGAPVARVRLGAAPASPR